MRRRQFLQYGLASGAALTWSEGAFAQSGATRITLAIEPVDVEMIDGAIVFMLLFYKDGAPRPVLRAREGDRIELTIQNNDRAAHGFAIPGAPGATIPTIPAGAARQVSFIAPRGGTYLFFDPLNAPLYRLVGLAGAFVVAPRDPTTPAGVVTPFSRDAQTAGVRALFEALGPEGRFPGHAWRPARERVWLFENTDPRLNRRVEAGEAVDPGTIAANFTPRYFTLNGLSGFDAAHDPATRPEGYIGEPMLLRVLNAGLATHSPHIHGNHVMELSGVDDAGAVVAHANIVEKDSWMMRPLDRKDMLLPFERPPDIPLAAFPMREEPFPLRYPMHCHMEMSQTAGGGNYPQGLVTDWEILGPKPPEIV